MLGADTRRRRGEPQRLCARPRLVVAPWTAPSCCGPSATRTRRCRCGGRRPLVLGRPLRQAIVAGGSVVVVGVVHRVLALNLLETSSPVRHLADHDVMATCVGRRHGLAAVAEPGRRQIACVTHEPASSGCSTFPPAQRETARSKRTRPRCRRRACDHVACKIQQGVISMLA